MDVQPKCVAVGPGGYAVVVCIGQVRSASVWRGGLGGRTELAGRSL